LVVGLDELRGCGKVFIRKMILRKFLVCTVALIIPAGFLIGCGEKAEIPEIIKYQVLRQWTVPAGGIGMEILVSEDAAKEEVLALASSLHSKYLPEGYIYIQIFDSLSAYNHRDDPNYPDEDYFKHFLVDISRNTETGYDEILWVAEGRGH
jgi:hypothetical protein